MKKVKEFIEEHKMKIAGVIACGVSYGIGVYVGYRHCMRDITVLGDGIIQFQMMPLNDMITGRVHMVFVLTMDTLGKIGEKMMKVGVPADKVFTHFITIGSPDEK